MPSFADLTTIKHGELEAFCIEGVATRFCACLGREPQGVAAVGLVPEHREAENWRKRMFFFPIGP